MIGACAASSCSSSSPPPAAAAPAPIKVAYDAAHLDLDKHVLQFKLSRAIAEATLTAIGEDGSELGKGAATYKAPRPAWLAITWTQPAHTRVMMLKLRVAASDGIATNVELVPWSVDDRARGHQLRDRQRGDRGHRAGEARRRASRRSRT